MHRPRSFTRLLYAAVTIYPGAVIAFALGGGQLWAADSITGAPHTHTIFCSCVQLSVIGCNTNLLISTFIRHRGRTQIKSVQHTEIKQKKAKKHN